MENTNNALFALEFALEEHLSKLNSRIDSRLFESLKKDALNSSNGLHIYKPVENPFARKEASPLDDIFQLNDSLPRSQPQFGGINESKKMAIIEAEFMGSFGTDSKLTPAKQEAVSQEAISPIYFFKDESLLFRFKTFIKSIKKSKIDLPVDNSHPKKSITDFLRKIKVYPLLCDALKYQTLEFNDSTSNVFNELLLKLENQTKDRSLAYASYLLFVTILTCVNLTFETSKVVAAHLKINILANKMHTAYPAFIVREKVFDDIKITPTEKKSPSSQPVGKIVQESRIQSQLPEVTPSDILSNNFISNQERPDDNIDSQLLEMPQSIVKTVRKTVKIIFEDICLMNATNPDLQKFEISAHSYIAQIKKSIRELSDKPLIIKKPELQKLSVQNYHKIHKEISKQANFDIEEYLNQNPYVFRFCELKNQLKRDLVSQLDSFYTSPIFTSHYEQFFSTLTKFFTKQKKNDLIYFSQVHEQLKNSKLSSLVCLAELKLLFKISMDMMYSRLNKEKANDRIAVDLEGLKLFGSLLELKVRSTINSEADYFLTDKFFRL